jgi:hypothetical protein
MLRDRSNGNRSCLLLYFHLMTEANPAAETLCMPHIAKTMIIFNKSNPINVFYIILLYQVFSHVFRLTLKTSSGFFFVGSVSWSVIYNSDIVFFFLHTAAALNILTCVCSRIVSYKKYFTPLIFIPCKSATQRNEYWCERDNLIFLGLCFKLQINNIFIWFLLYVKISVL